MMRELGIGTMMLVALSGCGSVRFLTTKCSLPDGSTVSMESKTYAEKGIRGARDPAEILPNNFSFNNMTGRNRIEVMVGGVAKTVLATEGVDGWHVGGSNPVVKSHYIFGSGIYVRIDFVEPDRLSLVLTSSNQFDDNRQRPEDAITRIPYGRFLVRVGGFDIDSNWTQSEVVKNNKIVSTSESAGHFSMPDDAGFEIRLQSLPSNDDSPATPPPPSNPSP